jgi:hypothetical protein
LKAYGFRLELIAGDGNCLYNAVRHLLPLDIRPESACNFRREVVKYIQKDDETFQRYSDGFPRLVAEFPYLQVYSNFNEYLHGMANPKETIDSAGRKCYGRQYYGGEIEMKAMSEMFNRRIIAVTTLDDLNHALNAPADREKIILHFTQMDHFNALERLPHAFSGDDDTKTPSHAASRQGGGIGNHDNSDAEFIDVVPICHCLQMSKLPFTTRSNHCPTLTRSISTNISRVTIYHWIAIKKIRASLVIDKIRNLLPI